MSDRVLKQATRALSESGEEQRGAHFTRERLMASLHERKRRSQSRFVFSLPLVAILVGSTAFAAVTGKLEVFVLSVLNVVGVLPTASAPASARLPHESAASPGATAHASSEAAREPQVGSASATEPVSESEGTEQLGKALGEISKTVAGARSRSRSATTEQADDTATIRDNRARDVGEVTAPGAAVADGHAVYRRAHEAHFGRGDLAAAIQGYEQYLARQPSGRFAVDARYNRALCLVRLGRTVEAGAILERFARGAYGGYRQADAARLLQALRATDGDAARGDR